MVIIGDLMKKNVLPVSVLIPTMNRPQALKRTIEGYLNADYIPSQIVVVDQSETEKDSTLIWELLKKIEEVEAVYFYQEIPSLTMARNNAFRHAKEEIIVCSDDDIDVFPDTIFKVYNMMKDSSIAMIAGLDDNMPLGKSKIGYLLGTKSFVNRKKGHVTASMLGRYPESVGDRTETMWAMGFFFVIRQSLVEKWQLEWDKKLKGYAYAEDLDFSYGYYKKAQKENLNCIMSNQIHVKHLASQEYRTPSRKSTYMYVLHRAYLSEKHHMGWKSQIAMGWCNFWIYLQRRIISDGYEDMRDAIKYLRKHKIEVINGVFNYVDEVGVNK